MKDFTTLQISLKCVLIGIFCTLSLLVNAQTIKVNYIDPGYTGTSNGTINQPYKDIPQIESDNTYLLKGGTTLKAVDNYGANVDNVKISTYGSGKASIYFSADISGRLINLRGNNNTIENLDVRSDNHQDLLINGVNNPNACTVVELYVMGGKGYITNVSVKGGHRGIVGGHYSTKTGNLYITDCTIDSVQHDGMYITYLDSLVIKNCQVTNTNLGWAVDYGGDGIQTGDLNHVVIDGCTIDHSTTYGKYCLITNGFLDCVVKNCYFKSDSSEACFYPGSGDTTNTLLTVTNCVFEGGIRCIQNRSDSVLIQNCLFKPCEHTLYALDGNSITEFENCTFANFQQQLISCYGNVGDLVGTFNNCLFYNNSEAIFGNAGNIIGENNNFYHSPINDKAELTGTLELDPKFIDMVNFVTGDTTLIRLNIGYQYTADVPVNPTNTQEYEAYTDGFKFDVFPNPYSGGNLTIVSKGSEVLAGTLKIVDLQGKIILTAKLPAGEKVTQIYTNLKKGNYIVTLINAKHCQAMKLSVL